MKNSYQSNEASMKSENFHANRILKKMSLKFRHLTSSIRILPSFIIIGFPRCGTTSLYNYLIQHPSVAPPLKKEIFFFGANFEKGINWYKRYFPTLLYKYQIRKHFRNYFLTGEGSATYIHHPLASDRIKKTIPQAKLIVMLRNPIDRAYSQYFKIVNIGRENLSFEDAIEIESKRIEGEWEKMINNKNYYSMDYHNYSYLSSGIYVDKLKGWLNSFPKNQILILKSEDFYNDPSSIFKTTLKFLNLPNWELQKYKKYNYYDNKPPLHPTIRKKLVDYFKPHNERLNKLLGRNFGWDE